MHVLFVSNYFPPEVNAPATRIYEHAKEWIKEGGSVEVLTSVPNYPEGVLYPNFRNRFSRELVDGIPVTRVPMYIAENKGTIRRTLSYISFMLATILYSGRLQKRPDLIVATSPQLFGAIGGYVVSRLRRVPFVLEIRDLWPESITAVGAIKFVGIIKFFERIAQFLYKNANEIIVVTDSFKQDLIAKGINPEKITILKNGVNPEFFSQELDSKKLSDLRKKYGLEEKFVAAYIGTIGMAHRADILLEAAKCCSDPNLVFIVVGTGAERESLAQKQAQLQVPNFRLIDKQPKEMIPYFLQITDVSVVHLKDTPLFQKVIPSKMFESMVMRKPIVLGVKGEARQILEEAQAGIAVEPENAQALADAVAKLSKDKTLYQALGNNGFTHVAQHYDRKKIAKNYWNSLEKFLESAPIKD
ncbi:MAG: glycosyltransferase family 4 protein [SAR324 cluster bacterium]|nr:glycosyltransferase family 4 protein [SAR324 cluster bacterium]